MTTRQSNDFYPTDPTLALKITERVAELILTPDGVIEPSAGTGVFIQAAKKVWPGVPVVGVDIEPRMLPFMQQAGADQAIIDDWTNVTQQGFVPGITGIGNLPFSLAEAHVRAAMGGPQPLEHLAVLLRMSFMGSQERVPFWREFPLRYLIPIVPRPNFMQGMVGEDGKKKGGDNSEYAVFVWKAGFKGVADLLPTLVWREPKVKRH